MNFYWARGVKLSVPSGAITVGTLTIAVCTPYAGRLIDSLGVRPILMGTIGGFAFTFASLYFFKLKHLALIYNIYANRYIHIAYRHVLCAYRFVMV